MKKVLGKPSETNKKLISLIERVKVNNFYLKNKKDFRDQILDNINADDDVLDIGKAMRDRHDKINCKMAMEQGMIATLDNVLQIVTTSNLLLM